MIKQLSKWLYFGQITGMEPIPEASRASKKRTIPDSLIYEVKDGQPIYRKGYKSVLNKKKTLEDIMGSRTLQSEVHVYINSLLFARFGVEKRGLFLEE